MHSFDRADLATYLALHIDGFGTLDDMEKFSDGQSNPTYLLRSGDAHYVLRAKPPGQLLKSAHAVDREFRVMAALEQTDVPVPAMLHLSEDVSPLGPQFFVMEYLEGRIFWDPALPEVAHEDRAAIYDAMNRALSALHTVDVTQVGLSDYGKPGNYFERQVGRWSQQYKAAQTEPLRDADWVMDWLGANMVADDGTVAIVHGDYRIDNMIFAKDRPEILALLDWELSTLGHPLADLAYQCMHWRLPNAAEFKGLAGVDRAAIGLPTEDDYVAQYCARRGCKYPITGLSFLCSPTSLSGHCARCFETRAGRKCVKSQEHSHDERVCCAVGQRRTRYRGAGRVTDPYAWEENRSPPPPRIVSASPSQKVIKRIS